MLSSEFNKYTESEEFKETLKAYEESQGAGSPCFLEAEELIDIAEYYHMCGQMDKSERAAKYCLEQYPGNASALLFLARLELMDFGHLNKAKEYFNSVSAEAGVQNGVEALYIQAEILTCEGRTADADRMLWDSYSERRRKYVLLFDETGKLTDTRENILDNAETDDEEDQLVTFFNFPLDTAMMFCDHEEYAIAEKWMCYADSMSDVIEYHETWARIYYCTNRNEEAIKAWNKVLDIDAYNANAWMSLWEAQFTAGKYEDALQSTEYLLAVQPGLPEGLIARANTLYNLKRYHESIDTLRDLQKKISNDPLGEMLISLAYVRLGDFMSAINHVERTVKCLGDLPVEERLEVIRFAGHFMKDFQEVCSRLLQAKDEIEAKYKKGGKKDEALDFNDKHDFNDDLDFDDLGIDDDFGQDDKPTPLT